MFTQLIGSVYTCNLLKYLTIKEVVTYAGVQVGQDDTLVLFRQNL